MLPIKRREYESDIFWCAYKWKMEHKLGSRLIFDECAVAVVFVRKQMGKMRKTAAHTFNLDLFKQFPGQTGLTGSDERTCSWVCWEIFSRGLT